MNVKTIPPPHLDKTISGRESDGGSVITFGLILPPWLTGQQDAKSVVRGGKFGGEVDSG